MALTGLDIYKLLPKTNCKQCGFATCLAFAMALAQKKVSLDKCPHVSREAREALESASQPPIRLLKFGSGERAIEVGNETVMYRHEQKFFHPSAIGFLIEDTLEPAAVEKKISDINGLAFERVGQIISPDLVCIKNSSGNKDVFLSLVSKVVSGVALGIALCGKDAGTISEAAALCLGKKPLLICPDPALTEDFLKVAKEKALPLALTCGDIEEAARLTDSARRMGVEDLMISFKDRGTSRMIQDFTFMRRMALKKSFRPLGYPVLAFTDEKDPHAEMAQAISYVLKYAGIVILKNTDKAFLLPLLVARQDVYSDPQKPVQVEPRIYEIGKVASDSPLLITTNFSITYFTVAGEVEASKVPAYILCCDSEGMSVLTAWAAEKFTPEKIDEAMKKFDVSKVIAHKKVIIPGYVSVMSGKLEEISGWKVNVGPREASGLPNFLRGYK